MAVVALFVFFLEFVVYEYVPGDHGLDNRCNR